MFLLESPEESREEEATTASTYDKVHEQILHMADALSDGIQAQHPQHFKG